MREITQDIAATLARHGVDDARVETRLAPAWTTDWMSEKGRAAQGLRHRRARRARRRHLRHQPPPRRARHRVPALRRDTRLVSDFGSTSCKALYRCVACREPFDYFKTH